MSTHRPKEAPSTYCIDAVPEGPAVDLLSLHKYMDVYSRPQTGRSADTKLGTVQMQHWQQTYCTLFSVAPQTEFGRRFVMRVCAGCANGKLTIIQFLGSLDTVTFIYLIH